MRSVVFAYHNMGLAGLEALLRSGYEIASIFSHDDDPRENCWFGSVKEWAASRAIPVHCPADVNRPEWIARIADLEPEVLFSFYYRQMISEEILRIPRRGAYNLHGSLLPAYRGRCPVNWVLVQGEDTTGVTLHHMVKKADAGDIVGQTSVPIGKTDTAFTLYEKLCRAAGELLDRLLPLLKEGKAPRIAQEAAAGSYFGGRRPEDGRIDWQWPAERIYNLVRAVTEPYPGAFCTLPDGTPLTIWWAVPEEAREGEPGGVPGTVRIDGNGVVVTTGRGGLRLMSLETGDARITGERLIQYFKDREGLMLS